MLQTAYNNMGEALLDHQDIKGALEYLHKAEALFRDHRLAQIPPLGNANDQAAAADQDKHVNGGADRPASPAEKFLQEKDPGRFLKAPSMRAWDKGCIADLQMLGKAHGL
jgi:hypothetical protein